MGELSGLARTDRQRVCLSAKSAPHSLTGCFYYRDRRLFGARQEQSKSRRLVASLLQTEEGEQRRRTACKRRKASHGMRSIPTWRCQCGVGVAAISPVDSIRSWMSFKRKKTIPNSSVFSNSYHCELGILLLLFLSSVKLCHQGPNFKTGL